MTDDERFKRWGEWIMVIYEDLRNTISSSREVRGGMGYQ